MVNKQETEDALKISLKRVIQKTTKAAGDLIGDYKVLRNSKQNNSETVTNELDKEIPKQTYISRRKT